MEKVIYSLNILTLVIVLGLGYLIYSKLDSDKLNTESSAYTEKYLEEHDRYELVSGKMPPYLKTGGDETVFLLDKKQGDVWVVTAVWEVGFRLMKLEKFTPSVD
jgi:hypothetical protein